MEKLFGFVHVDFVPKRSSVLSLFSLTLLVNQDLISPRQSEGEVDGRVEVGPVDR